MNCGEPSFSILVPVFNHERFVGAALDSLIKQADGDWEAVVVDDGSTDGTPRVLAEYARRDRRIRVFRQANGGCSTALNEALRQARGAWIGWLSSDDEYAPDALGTFRRGISRSPGVRFLHARHAWLQSETGVLREAEAWRPPSGSRYPVTDVLRCVCIHQNTVMAHRSLYDQAGTYNARFRYSQDYDMILRMVRHAVPAFLNETVYHYRQHDNQMSRYRDACLYDCGWAGLEFLNRTPFPDLFTGVAWDEVTAAREALDAALDVAASPHAHLYKLGVHLALILRIFEWLWGGDDPVRLALRRYAIARARTSARTQAGTPLGFLWRVAAAATTVEGQRFVYRPVPGEHVAAASLQRWGAEGDARAQTLRAYLDRLGIHPPDPVPAGEVAKARAVGRVFVVACAHNIVVDDPVRYGAHRMTVEAARFLQRTGRNVLLAGLSANGLGHAEGIPFVSSPDNEHMPSLVRALRPMDALVSVARSDLLTPSRAHHSLIYHHNPGYIPGDLSVAALRRSGVVVACVSQNSARLMVERGLESHHVRVVPNAVDTAVFGSSPQVVRGPHALVWVGGLWRYKRVDRALRAYRRIRAEFSDATLDIYGEDTDVWRPDADFEFEDGWVNREGRLVWDRIERDLPGLRYRGVVPPATLAQVYSAASNLILPSDGDDFPLVSLEAQACGCLPILPRQGGLAETVLDGQTGFVYSPNTSGALADAALSLWHRRLPTDEQRSAARRWVPMTFTYDRTGQSLLDALAESKLTRMAWCWLIRLEVQRQIRRLLRVTP